MTVVAVGGGFSYGQLGVSHFATEDLAIMRTLPGMTVVAPSDPWQAYELTRQLHARAPAYLRIDKGLAGLPPGEVRLGKVSEVRTGEDAVIFATGGILVEAVAASDLLRDEGISVRVVDVHTIKPLDVDFDRRIGARLRSRADARGTCHRGRAWRRNRGNLP